MNHLVLVSGCSGGGKSTLVAELARRGIDTVDEPGRRIVSDELGRGGTALPWVDMEAFARRAVAVACADWQAASGRPGPIVFDRGVVDAAAALEHVTGQPALAEIGQRFRYRRQVFLTPPWPEIWRNDEERRHGFTEAAAEHQRLCDAFERLGYQCVEIPRMPVDERAAFLIAAIARPSSRG